MYEGLFLSAFTAFESFLESLFLRLLVEGGRHGNRRVGPIPRVTVRSYGVARTIVVGSGRKYADWLPYDLTIQRAELFFRAGKPFTRLQDKSATSSVKGVRDVLDRGVVIRNAIAHKSKHSLERFEREALRGIPLGPRERTPAGFLRGALVAAPPQTRFESYVSGVLAAARVLCR